MTITYNVSEKFKKIAPAAVHIDGTARPQIVRQCDNKRYHTIIREFYNFTDIPLIINTSFNMHEEPIICTPADAVRAFNMGAVDAATTFQVGKTHVAIARIEKKWRRKLLYGSELGVPISELDRYPVISSIYTISFSQYRKICEEREKQHREYEKALAGNEKKEENFAEEVAKQING